MRFVVLSQVSFVCLSTESTPFVGKLCVSRRINVWAPYMQHETHHFRYIDIDIRDSLTSFCWEQTKPYARTQHVIRPRTGVRHTDSCPSLLKLS